MEDAKATIRQTLDQVKRFLAQEAPPKLSEADTKAHFIEPIVAGLGWEGIGVVVREYYVKNSQEFIDYLMRGPAGPLLALEAKPLQADLTDKHAAQLIQYCAVEGIEWAALTNGRELQFFNTFLKPDLAAKRVLRLDLLAFNSDAEFDPLFEQVWQLSRESMTTPTGVRSWLHQRRLDAALRSILLTPGSPTIRTVRKGLADAEVSASPQEVVQWFRSHLGTPVTVLPPAPARPATVSSPPVAASRPTGQPAARSASITMGERQYLLTPVADEPGVSAQETIERLVGAGWYVFRDQTPGRKALKPGDRLCFYESGKGVVADAEVASYPERRVLPEVRESDKFPWAFRLRNAHYFFEDPVVIDAELRGRLDAFAGRDATSTRWSWFVQGTHRVSAHDFALLTGQESVAKIAGE